MCNFFLRGEGWRWKRNIDARYDIDQLYGCLIVMLGLTQRRVAIARQIETGAHAQWRHCESFVANEARAMGLNVVDLANLIPNLRNGFSARAPF